MYTTQRYQARIPVGEYLEKYVDIPTFLKACQQCPNYGNLWSCPPYEFNVEAYWKNYGELQLIATKIMFGEEYLEKSYLPEEIQALITPVLAAEKQKLSDELMKLEEEYPGSISLSAGSCQKCGKDCTRKKGHPCRYPRQMRYSIESLGGNVGMTLENLMGLKLEWMEEGKLPGHFVLVSGLLIP